MIQNAPMTGDLVAPAVRDPRRVAGIGALVVVSWLGEYVHNLIELPDLTPLSPENSIVALVSLVLFAGWWLLPPRRAWALALLLWGLLHLIGGGVLSALPLPIWWFVPELNPLHVFAHVIYAAAQLPLLWAMAAEVRRP